MTTVNLELVNSNFGNSLNYNNPVFKEIISNLISSGLFNDNLAIGSQARIPGDSSIQIYNNLADSPENVNRAIALEVIVDSISRAILKGYQEGFTQGASTTFDGASNIGYKESSKETLATPGLALSTATNVHEALNILAREIANIKIALGNTIPPQPVIPSPSVHIK